ncbi:MAG: tRNA (adenosine(37)-N6)-threonylcarbamoyltransferase complex dimerization subunit type 1 TsaB [Exilispira sp.]
MNTLVIDSSTQNCHVCLKSNDRWATFNSNTHLDHTRHILLLLDSTLKTLDVKTTSIDYALCGTGPGSFTGIRISHSLIKGLFFKSKTLILPVPTISLFAFSLYFHMIEILPDISTKIVIYSIIFGKKNRYYFSKYTFNDPEKTLKIFLNPQIEDISFEEIQKIIYNDEKILPYTFLTIDDIESIKDNKLNKIKIFKSFINGIDIINFFEDNFESFETSLIDPEKLLPLYSRKPDAEENLKK